MQEQRRGSFPLLKILSTFAWFALLVSSRNADAGELVEMEAFFNFIKALDPKNVLGIEWNLSIPPHPCSQNQYWKGVECSKKEHAPPASSPVAALTKLKNLETMDISDNYFDTDVLGVDREFRFKGRHRILLSDETAATERGNKQSQGGKYPKQAIIWILVGMVVVFIFVLAFFLKLRSVRAAKYEDSVALSPRKSPPVKIAEEVKAEERRSELVFFVQEQEMFGLEELVESAAHLCRKGSCNSLYKVRLKNNVIFAVKQLKILLVSFEDFGQTMRKIGNLKHPNLLPLVGYNSSDDNKLLIYRYQSNGSLKSLLENHIEGKKIFPWKLRFSIAVGIARGLKFIYQWLNDGEIIPHGNIKPANILLNENLEPLISEYGFSKFLNFTKPCNIASLGYTAPEKGLTELGDVYSFGVIMLELLTGKIAAKQKQEKGLDLPKWVKARVREEWTGEVFDKEISKVEMYGFPLLNISLKCVSKLPQDRPSISELLEKIEEVVNAQEDISPSSSTSCESD